MTETTVMNNHAGQIWAIADLLRGDHKQSEYGRVILPHKLQIETATFSDHHPTHKSHSAWFVPS